MIKFTTTAGHAKRRAHSLIMPDVIINVYLDGSGGYFSHVNEPNRAISLVELTEDMHVRLVMHKEWDALMRRRLR